MRTEPDLRPSSFLAQGLTSAEATERLSRFGPNELPATGPRRISAIVTEVAREPMFILLIAAGSLYLTMGELGDAVMLLGFVFVVMGITVVQERRTERALDALRDLSSPRALVIRDGQRIRIPGREVVPGDLLVLCEGDRVAADALVRRTDHLAADESLLTGESVPVTKRAIPEARELDSPGGDNLASVFAGAMITSGEATAEVVATGVRTALGRIGKSLLIIEPEPTRLQQETGRIVRILAVGGLIACSVVTILYGLTRGADWQAWKQGLLAGIAMAMSLLPEEFTVILTVFLALGAWRISHSRVLTRRMPVIEDLGAATVLCVDKTGTLTQNRMTVRALVTPTHAVTLGDVPGDSLPDGVIALLQTACRASRAQPFDPMERALMAAQSERGLPDAKPHGAVLREYPLSSALLAVSYARASPADPDFVEISTKGAPEAVAQLCQLDATERDWFQQALQKLTANGFRVLAVARTQRRTTLPAVHSELRTTLLGLIAFEDPLREEVPSAVAECTAAGIRVVMITGDSPLTARSIAAQAGIARDAGVITGIELASLSDPELDARISGCSVFARVVPEQKLRIVESFKRRGEIVAMTGDGVNDAPALRAAQIGIAMGGRGTDVAREAAALVLLDDDLESIVAAVRLGRRIYENVKKAVSFTIAVHVPIAGLSLAPVLFSDWPLLLLPVHIVFLELIIDPSCSLIFEAEEADPDIMRRRPRAPDAPLFSAQTLSLALLQGLSLLAVCLLIVFLGLGSHGPGAARALAFATLVTGFLTIILVNRSWSESALHMMRKRNPALWWVLGGTALLLACVLTLPVLQNLFHFAPLHPADLLASILAGIACLIWFEVLKCLRRVTRSAVRT